MRLYWRCFLLCAAFVVVASVAIPFGQRRDVLVPEALPLNRWDVLQLASYLKEAGLNLRPQSVQEDGRIGQSVYLTSTEKDWQELNGLIKDPKRIHQWRGIVFCTYEGPIAAENLARQWGDQGLLVGPFVFYGDGELLARINVALNRPAPLDAP